MRLIRHLQHWLGGSGPGLRVADVVPKSNSIRQWSDTLVLSQILLIGHLRVSCHLSVG